MKSRHWNHARRATKPGHQDLRSAGPRLRRAARVVVDALERRLLLSATVQFSTASETVNESAGTFSIPVTLSGTPAPTVSTFASGAVEFSAPDGLAFDSAGNLYAANDVKNGTVDKVTPAGVVSIFASGLGGVPADLAFDHAGNLYVSRYTSNAVEKVTPAGTVSTFAAGFNHPDGLAFDAAGNLYVANYSANDTVAR